MNENFHFFTPAYFLIFQNDESKNRKKELSTLPGGFRGCELFFDPRFWKIGKYAVMKNKNFYSYNRFS